MKAGIRTAPAGDNPPQGCLYHFMLEAYSALHGTAQEPERMQYEDFGHCPACIKPHRKPNENALIRNA